MANETYLKPHSVAFGGVDIKKVERIDSAEVSSGRPQYGDAAVWPTSNKRHLRNARVTVTCRDHAAADALYQGMTGNLAFSVKVESTGGTVSRTYANLIVVDRNVVLGGDVEAVRITFEVETADGVAGPWS